MSFVIDCLSLFSVVGIWPRFIEPRRLLETQLNWQLTDENAHLDGLKIVQLSDLHFHKKSSKRFLKKLQDKLAEIKPDLILFTGDFICYSQLEKEELLYNFLSQLHAPMGKFSIPGNHDYSRYVSKNSEGVYDTVPRPNPFIGICKGLKRLFSGHVEGYAVSDSTAAIPPHEELLSLLKRSGFTHLDNTSVTLPIGLNICGLGDLALGQCLPKNAFKHYCPEFPGIILSHNPDSFPKLLDFPGDWILSGHTHGEQIHIPWPKWGRKISQKLARLENRTYTRGLFPLGKKFLYVNRGLGSHIPFRLFSPPEVTTIRAKL